MILGLHKTCAMMLLVILEAPMVACSPPIHLEGRDKKNKNQWSINKTTAHGKDIKVWASEDLRGIRAHES